MSIQAAVSTLPEGYRLKTRLDLMRNRKHLKWMLWLSFAALLVCILGGWLLVTSPIALAQGGFWLLIIRSVALVLGIIVYAAAHEAVHGILMWLFSRKKPRFGFKIAYAYASSDAYFAKWPYLCIALAPLLIWGVVFARLCTRVPDSWFWVVWGWQMTNLSGAAGDLYVVFRILPLRASLLIRDSGAAMMLYDRP